MVMMGDKLRDFIRATIGQRVQVAGGLGGQCVDLCELWILGLGATRTYADALNLLRAADPAEWLMTVNRPDNYPPEGAIVVWGPYAGFGIGDAGHCAIVRWADVGRLDVYQQNYPNGSPASYGSFPHYGGVIGWMDRRGPRSLV